MNSSLDKPFFCVSLFAVVFCTKINHSYLIKKGERFAQIVPEVISYAKGEEVKEFETKYGDHGGWGSTGK